MYIDGADFSIKLLSLTYALFFRWLNITDIMISDGEKQPINTTCQLVVAYSIFRLLLCPNKISIL